MQMIGFVMFCIGLMVTFFARRIVRGKTKLDQKDEEEMRLLTAGAVIAVRLAGLVVAAVGIVFLVLGYKPL